MQQRGKEAVGFKTREEFSGFPPQNESMARLGAFCSLLHPAPLLLKKGRDRRGPAVPPNSCSSHYTSSLPGLDLLCLACPAMAGPLMVPGCWKSSSIPRGRLIRIPQWGGRIQPFVLQRKTEKQSCKCPSCRLLSQADHADPMQTDCDPRQSLPAPAAGVWDPWRQLPSWGFPEPPATEHSLIKKRKTP